MLATHIPQYGIVIPHLAGCRVDCQPDSPNSLGWALFRTPPSLTTGVGLTTGQAKSPSGTQAIDRAFDVLSSFVACPEQGITDIADRTDLKPSTVHRIVRALVSSGYLEQRADTDNYRFGHAALVLGQSAREALGFSLAMPILEQLGGETGESINMGVRDGGEVVVVLRVESVQPLRFDQPAGSRIPLHCSSMGKSLLAFSDSTIDDLSLTKITDTTVTTKTALRKELKEIRSRGFSFDHEESIPGVSCVGAPVLDGEGRAVAAIAVQAPTVRMPTERQLAIGRRVVQATNEISAAMRLTTVTAQND